MPTEKGLLGHFLWVKIGSSEGMATHRGEKIPILIFLPKFPVFRETREPVIDNNESVSMR